jgi:uncharacterized protein YggT (Ycf19 family)
MNWVDLILNIAGLLLWLNWRVGKDDPVGKRTPATLVGTLRRAEPLRMQRWHLPYALGALILLRAVFYWMIGSALGWAGSLNLGVITLSFRSDRYGHDWFGRILLFSILSFALTLGIFYSCLLLLSILKGPKPIQDFVRIQLGGMDGWSSTIKLILPFAATVVCWSLVSWLLVRLQIIPPVPESRRLIEAAIIGLEGYLIWKFPVALILGLHLLNSYIYFGRHPVWNYADVTAQSILRPLNKIPLRFWKVDLAPIVGIAVVFAVAQLAGAGLHALYLRSF